MIGRRAVDPMVGGSLRPDADWHSNGHAAERSAQSEGFDAWEELRREIARSRRYGHEFVLIRIPLAALPPPVRRSRWSRLRRSRDLARALRSLVRTLDRVWTSNGSLYLLLPESNRAAGEGLLARVREAAPELLPDRGVRLAAFPVDGLTSGALLEAVSKSNENRALGHVRESVHRASLPAREGENDDGRIRVPALHAEPGVEMTERSMARAQGR